MLEDLESRSKPELIEIIRALDKLVKLQQEEIKMLKRRVSDLEITVNRLRRDSSTSSKAPSSDITKDKKKEPASQRERSGRKIGGQPGHKGFTKEQVLTPDKIEILYPSSCENCGNVFGDEIGTLTSKRQVFDIPPIVPFVTEYQQYGVVCSCGHCTRGKFPKEAGAPVQVGEKIKALMIYLNINQLVPYDRLSKLCHDLFGFSVSKRTIENSLEEGLGHALPLHRDIMQIIKLGTWVGSDETGKRVTGKRWWEWVWQNDQATYYTVSPSRGYEVVADHFGEDYRGIMIHDCWSAQNNTQALHHQQCHYHLQRDLLYLIKNYRSVWAHQMYKLLLSSQRARDRIYAKDFSPKLRAKAITYYQTKLDDLIASKQNHSEVITLQKRFTKHRDAIFTFMNYSDVPAHNNASEQAVRMTKVKQKISGGHRSTHGAQRHSVLLSIVETAKKQKMNVLGAIEKLVQGNLVFLGT